MGSANPDIERAAGLEIARRPARVWVWLGALAIVAAGGLAYATSFNGKLLFDDARHITDNGAIRRLWPPAYFLGNNRPLVYLTFALNYAVSGLREWSYHALNLAVHLAAALVLMEVLRRLWLQAGLGAWRLTPQAERCAAVLAGCAALLWAVHPLQTQAVTYVVQRMESLMALFFLLTLYCFQRGSAVGPASQGMSRSGSSPAGRHGGGRHEAGEHGAGKGDKLEAGKLSALSVGRRASGRAAGREALGRSAADGAQPRSWRRTGWFLAAVVCCALGMATKEVMVSAPLIVLLYDVLFVSGTLRAALRRHRWVHAGLAATWPILVVLWFAANYQGSSAGFNLQEITPWQYAATQPAVILRYLVLALWPSPLCFDYAWAPVQSAAGWVLPAAAIIVLLAGCVYGLRRRHPAGFAAAAFFLVLAPTSSILAIADLAVEHRMYLPLAAVAGSVAGGGWAVAGRILGQLKQARLKRPSKAPPKRAPAAAAAHKSAPLALTTAWWTAAFTLLASAVLATVTARRNLDYHDPARMWSSVLECGRPNPRAHSSLGLLLYEQGRFSEAAEHIGEALRLKPDYADALNQMGMLLARGGRNQEAEEHFRKAIEHKPLLASGHNNLGLILARRQAYDEAIACYREALRLHPFYFEAHYNMGNALNLSGRKAEAIEHFRAALQVNAASAKAHNNLASVLIDTRQLEEALAHARQALSLDPGSQHARQTLLRAQQELAKNGSR